VADPRSGWALAALNTPTRVSVLVHLRDSGLV
jgi:hypothetical protein